MIEGVNIIGGLHPGLHKQYKKRYKHTFRQTSKVPQFAWTVIHHIYQLKACHRLWGQIASNNSKVPSELDLYCITDFQSLYIHTPSSHIPGHSSLKHYYLAGKTPMNIWPCNMVVGVTRTHKVLRIHVYGPSTQTMFSRSMTSALVHTILRGCHQHVLHLHTC